jgi:hypothetical protein
MMQKHINQKLMCVCALDLRLFVGNIVGAKFPVELVCETYLYGKCIFIAVRRIKMDALFITVVE